MALPRIGFNDGSLLRRTLVHVGTFVLGSMALIGVMSFVLVSIAKGIASPRSSSEGAEEEVTAAAIASAGGARAPAMGAAPLGRPGGHSAVKRGRTVPASSPSKDD